jgi:hypothetical protein
VHLRVSLKLKASARGIAKSGKVPVFQLLGFSMLVSVPLPSILLDIHVRRDGRILVRSERETDFCPSGDSNSQSVINHNPLPDIPHEEFVSLLGPLLAPEHYPSPESPLASPPLPSPPPSPIISAPFDWIHFEGRSVKTTLNNLQGLDGLARERRWRSQCVFSVDVGRRAKQGIEAVRTFF